jgi:hypothetical protein
MGVKVLAAGVRARWHCWDGFVEVFILIRSPRVGSEVRETNADVA